MYGIDINHHKKLTWEEYKAWQAWDEWPDCEANPPLTVETPFWYNGDEYLVTKLECNYVIVKQPEFTIVISSNNFLDLLTKPFINETSFKDMIQDILF